MLVEVVYGNLHLGQIGVTLTADSPKPLLALVSVFAVVGAILKVVIEHK